MRVVFAVLLYIGGYVFLHKPKANRTSRRKESFPSAFTLPFIELFLWSE